MTNSHGGSNDDRTRDEKFLRDVLARTSGSACDRACEQLSDLMGGHLVGMDRELVQSHLEHCEPCRTLAVTLGWLEPLLPQMAEIDPGPAFTARVLAATSEQDPAIMPFPAVPTGPAGLMDRVGSWWDRQILRPGFAAQLAYAATVVLVLLTSVPGAPLRGVPGKALEIVQAGPVAVPVVGPAMDKASGWVGSRADEAVTTARTGVEQRWEKTENSLGRRSGRTSGGRQELGTHVKEMISKAGDGKLGEASYELLAALKAGRAIWNEWWMDNDDDGRE
ncbi:MAG: zf-HC2 domain-containing protein [Candidatus Krumholzibacteriota bacterium]